MDKVWQGAALRRLRMLSQQSIQQVADKVGVTDGAISQWELGVSEPSREYLVAYAEAIGVPFDLLLEELGYPMPAVSVSLKDWYRISQASANHSRPASTKRTSKRDNRSSDTQEHQSTVNYRRSGVLVPRRRN